MGTRARCRQPHLLQSRRLPRQRLDLAHVSQRPSSPQPQRLPEPARRSGHLTSADRRLRRADQSLEPNRILNVGIEPEHVAASARRQCGIWV